MTESRRIYWDACIFIKQMNPAAPPRDKFILEGIDEVIEEAENDKAIIVTSSITRIEVLDCKIPPNGETRYKKFLHRELVQEYDVDPKIADAAHDIRSFYRKKGKDLGVADSVHVATACLRECPEMWTLEGTGQSPKLTALSGRIADRWDLKICAPRANSGRLFTFEDTKKANGQDDEKGDSKANGTGATGTNQPTAGVGRRVEGATSNATRAEKADKKET